MTKAKYSEKNIERFLNGVFPTYEEMMSQNKGILISLSQRDMADDKDVQKRLKEIFRLSLINSVRILHENSEERIDLLYIQEYHSGLDRAARKIYERRDGKSPWQQLVEDAGLTYPCRSQREWTLKSLLEEISSLGENSEDFSYRENYKRDTGSVGAASRIVGNWGKAVILAGINYLELPSVYRKKCEFTYDELERIILDKSLDYSSKVVALFNVSALQYYPLEENGLMSRNQDDLIGFRICQQDSFFDGPAIHISHLQKIEDLTLFAVSIALEGAVNRLYRQNFSFSSSGASERSINFYGRLELTLRLKQEMLEGEELFLH